MPDRTSRLAPDLPPEAAGDIEPAVVSVARRDPVDVPKALQRVRAMKADEDRAVALVETAFDVDAATVMEFLDATTQITDETWRARTIFSALQRAKSRFIRELPPPAQDSLVALVEGIRSDSARAALLRNLPSDLPIALRNRLAGLANALADPVLRLRTIVAFERKPSRDRAASLLALARGIGDELARGEALGIVAPLLSEPLLSDAFAAGLAITDAGIAGRALVMIARHFRDQEARTRAHTEILALAPRIADPIRRFDVLASLVDLPPESRRHNESALFDLATAFDDPGVRCRAMFMAAGFAEDEIARKNALLSGIAAAERVADLPRRSELLALLQPAGPWLDPAVRAEVRRAVDRIEDPRIQHKLRTTLNRMFVYERPGNAGADRRAEGTHGRDQTWDVFISYATADLEVARSIAFELKSRGLRVFLSADALDAEVGSNSWTTALDKAIEGARAMLVLVTTNSMASKWVAEEWRKYYRLMVDTESGHLFSLRLNGPAINDLPLTLRMYQVVDTPDGQLAPDHFSRILKLVAGR
jgi:hypothetical protein